MLSSSTDVCPRDASAAHWESRIIDARGGDREALGEMFQRLGAYLRARAVEQLDRQLSVKVSPSDVVQETLLEAHRGFIAFRGVTRAELVCWMQGILNHRVQTAQRRYRGTGKRNLSREKKIALSLETAHGELEFAVRGDSPSEYAVKNEELSQLDEALRRLTPRHEQVIRLRNELKLSFAEAAIAMNCSPNAVQKLWTRAVGELAQRMKRDATR